ncbi:MAG: type III-A CRISPR-associated RAMP protein Csm5 [Comamonadaceae bacterium CG_4_9_14_0_8_um_filter_60_18]|nr:type III-A CRISPR-associated RAMP protein Csm5 [Rhodoferax sp.]PIW07281.1 MAG: type III-A CRISPR-associated RAMP protein Csm5 [Comamonadaceae bacterium CG17_big_fil_post_rev_8_21_14_2_50_60_13]PJC13773.1 MAG: type III-A CRISPR-associated RAMP protein Csm5 [Comamonadaceae bacterium CG_4_9_14_0_8_um_filter_60_18]
MNPFLKTYRLALTPLSPIHIGCGEDFEPTNYVIDEGVLYGFDPSRAVLSEAQKSELKSALASNSLLSIQRFFKKHAKTFQTLADVLIPVATGVAQQYAEKVGKVANREGDGKEVFNKLAMERAISTGAQQQPFIPGSSFKGALRTSILDAINARRTPLNVEYKYARDGGKGEARSTAGMEKTLLGGDFESSPLRLLKVSDLMPQLDVARRIQYAVNQKKREVRDRNGVLVSAKGPTVRKECVQPGQYRLFRGSIAVPNLEPHLGFSDRKGKRLTPATEIELRRVALDTHKYHVERLNAELNTLQQRGFVNPDWLAAVQQLLNGELKAKMSRGDAFLIRLGRYGGADSKTLSGEDVAHIKIMGAKRQPPTFEGTTKTVWLAAEHENDQKHLLPFGWAVVEIDPQGDLPQLKAWCEVQSKGRPDMTQLRQQFEADKQAAMQQKAEQAALAAQRLEAKKAEELAAQKRTEALASMSAQGQLIEALRQKCENWASKMPPHGNFKHQEANLAKAGLFQDANKLAAQALAEPQWSGHDKGALADMLEQCLSKVVAPWGRDERKKLKISALRGQ